LNDQSNYKFTTCQNILDHRREGIDERLFWLDRA
jgi:hypothetical protein